MSHTHKVSATVAKQLIEENELQAYKMIANKLINSMTADQLKAMFNIELIDQRYYAYHKQGDILARNPDDDDSYCTVVAHIDIK